MYHRGLGKKRRYNLQRQERLLQEHLAEEVELVSIDRVGRLPDLYAAIDQLGARDPAILTREEYELACRHGILLCYVLRTKSRTIGLAIGLEDTGRPSWCTGSSMTQGLNKYSPGTALMAIHPARPDRACGIHRRWTWATATRPTASTRPT